MKKNEANEQFYRLFKGRITLADFENWLYYTPNIEEMMGSDLYFSLLDVKYQGKHAQMEVEKLVYPHIPFAECEEENMKSLLQEAIQGSGDIVKLLRIFYKDYCKGYIFLEEIAFLYFPFIDVKDESKLNETLECTLPILKSEAQRVLALLENGEIRITGDHQYEDHHKPE